MPRVSKFVEIRKRLQEEIEKYAKKQEETVANEWYELATIFKEAKETFIALFNIVKEKEPVEHIPQVDKVDKVDVLPEEEKGKFEPGNLNSNFLERKVSESNE